MDSDRREWLEFAAAQLVFVAALIHLGLGIVNWFRYLLAGIVVPPDARWPVFVVSGVAVLIGLVGGRRARDRRPYYAAGILVMLGYAVGYFTWHLGGHRRLLIAGPAPPSTEAVSIQWFLDHLFAGPLETVSVFAEVLAAVVLVVLLVSD